jgi:hypothetical protein
VPGDGRYEWAGFWRGDQLPSTYNPKSGFFTSSNEMNLPADYPYRERKLGFEWTNGSRHARIDEVLAKLDKVSLEDSMRLQNDMVSIPARRLMMLLSSNDADTQAALNTRRRQPVHPQPVDVSRERFPADQRPVVSHGRRRRQLGQLARRQPARPIRQPRQPALP